MSLQPSGTLRIGTSDIEYRSIGSQPDDAPTIVMPHEGLGSSDAWGDFPNKLQAATGAGSLLYSRAGYGASSPVTCRVRSTSWKGKRSTCCLSCCKRSAFAAWASCWVIPDGASIAAIYAGGIQDHRVRGVILMAPHFITEDFLGGIDP